MNTPEHAKTVALVPLRDHVAYAYLVAAMMKAQRAYFDAKKAFPHINPKTEWAAVRIAEDRVRAVTSEILARDQQPLPGFGEGGAAPPG